MSINTEYYKILNLNENASIAEIEESYEKLSDQVHAGKGSREIKNIRLEQLRKAYSSLIETKMEAEDEKLGLTSSFRWYVARSYIANEDKLIESLWDKIRQHKMVDSVKEIVSFKETVIDEGEEIFPDSAELPKLAFKNSKTTIWVKLKNGNFRKIRLRVKRPFKCFIFFNMLNDLDVFVKINSWALGLSFLEFPNLKVISEEEIKEMKGKVSDEIPDLNEYIGEKGYEIVSGSVSKHVNESASVYMRDEEDDEEGVHLIEKEEKFAGEVKEEEYSYGPTDRTRENIVIEKLKANDFVYVSEMGTKGVVLSVDVKQRIVTVNINLFGRNQTIKCKPEQLKEF
ncbi:NusG protein [Mycoplasma suis KI3806]|uniref:Transcription termination/antitermination protein NusG n=1 Tax=Mycoplasma suis (strain KI_3806) TaxID=708248 RepID=F0V2N2_MYCS3|nr:transcription termination/antitermination protein NusG [Mycoplasma suis]CBZ40104.1 NusG protein [Mycoplasma suis KI3806]